MMEKFIFQWFLGMFGTSLIEQNWNVKTSISRKDKFGRIWKHVEIFVASKRMNKQKNQSVEIWNYRKIPKMWFLPGFNSATPYLEFYVSEHDDIHNITRFLIMVYSQKSDLRGLKRESESPKLMFCRVSIMLKTFSDLNLIAEISRCKTPWFEKV